MWTYRHTQGEAMWPQRLRLVECGHKARDAKSCWTQPEASRGKKGPH